MALNSHCKRTQIQPWHGNPKISCAQRGSSPRDNSCDSHNDVIAQNLSYCISLCSSTCHTLGRRIIWPKAVFRHGLDILCFSKNDIFYLHALARSLGKREPNLFKMVKGVQGLVILCMNSLYVLMVYWFCNYRY